MIIDYYPNSHFEAKLKVLALVYNFLSSFWNVLMSLIHHGINIVHCSNPDV
jgi:phage-related protein